MPWAIEKIRKKEALLVFLKSLDLITVALGGGRYTDSCKLLRKIRKR